MSSWYIARLDELLIDLDEYMRPTKRGRPWGEEFFRLRAQSAIENEKLNVVRAFLIPSTSPKHYHALLRLAQPMTRLQCLVWQLHLGSDLYRGLNDLARLAYGVKHPSLLIRDSPIPNFWRPPDAICDCTKKHVTADQLALGKKACAIWRRYRGRNPYAIWGPPATPQYGVALPTGEVPLDLIMRKLTTKFERSIAWERAEEGAIGRPL